MPRRDELAFPTRERAVVDGEKHLERRLRDLDERYRLDLLRRAYRFAYRDVFDTAETHYVAYHRRFHGPLVESRELIDIGYFGFVNFGGVIVADGHFAVGFHYAALDPPYRYPAHVIVIIYAGNEYLQRLGFVAFGRGDVTQDRVEQRREILAGIGFRKARRSRSARTINYRTVQLLVARVKVDEQFVYLVHHFRGARVGLVYLVYADDYLVIHFESFLENEPRLRHRSFVGVHQKHHAVDHLEHPFHFSREIGVPRSIHYVYLYSFISTGSIFRKYRYPAFSFERVGVHDAVFHDLVVAEYPALLEHRVHERCLAVVDVRYYRYVS